MPGSDVDLAGRGAVPCPGSTPCRATAVAPTGTVLGLEDPSRRSLDGNAHRPDARELLERAGNLLFDEVHPGRASAVRAELPREIGVAMPSAIVSPRNCTRGPQSACRPW